MTVSLSDVATTVVANANGGTRVTLSTSQKQRIVNERNAAINNKPAEFLARLRQERDIRLAECDWTQAADAPSGTAARWQSYRQALRDITAHSNFPHDLTDDDWPTKP